MVTQDPLDRNSGLCRAGHHYGLCWNCGMARNSRLVFASCETRWSKRICACAANTIHANASPKTVHRSSVISRSIDNFTRRHSHTGTITVSSKVIPNQSISEKPSEKYRKAMRQNSLCTKERASIVRCFPHCDSRITAIWMLSEPFDFEPANLTSRMKLAVLLSATGIS